MTLLMISSACAPATRVEGPGLMDEVYRRHQIQQRAAATGRYLGDRVRLQDQKRREGTLPAAQPADPENYKDFQA